MADEINIKWNMSCGFQMNVPDWEFEIEADFLAGMTDEEIEEEVNRQAAEDFSQYIDYWVTNVDDIIAAVRAKEKRDNE